MVKECSKKIAIIGTAENSIHLGPYNDKSWDIWTITRALFQVSRCTKHFEVHDFEETINNNIFYSPEEQAVYDEYYKKASKNLYLSEPDPRYPDAQIFPINDLTDRFGKYFMSTAAYLMGYAIMQNPEEIGLWGINMDCNGEYQYQRENMLYYIRLAKYLGIKVTIPTNSSLRILDKPLYAYDQDSTLPYIQSKLYEMNLKKEQYRKQRDFANEQYYKTEGIIETLEHLRLLKLGV